MSPGEVRFKLAINRRGDSDLRVTSLWTKRRSICEGRGRDGLAAHGSSGRHSGSGRPRSPRAGGNRPQQGSDDLVPIDHSSSDWRPRRGATPGAGLGGDRAWGNPRRIRGHRRQGVASAASPPPRRGGARRAARPEASGRARPDVMADRGDTADEELQVCDKCCAQFEDQDDLAQHKERCVVNNPVVVIVSNQDDGTPATHQRVKPPEPSSAFRASDTQCPGLIAGTPEMQVPRVGATPANDDCKSSGVAGFPGMGMSRSYWSDPRSRENGSSQPFLTRGDGLNQDDALSPKIGQGPHDAHPRGGPTGTPLNIPMILEELRVLQQRQIHQMQMTEQICRQVLMLGSLTQPAVPVAASGGPSPTSPGTGSKTMPTFSAVKMNPMPEVAKTMHVAEVPKQAFFQLYNPLGNPFSERSLPTMPSMKPKTLSHFDDKSIHGPASLPTSPPGQLLSAHAAFPAGILAPQVGMFLGTRVVEPVPSLLKQKNGEPAYIESLQEKSSGRHKCRFCAKVFGSDSALQIHLRSHTGERPYKCNICGNRFTTRGNLKVHFQRHKDKYPHIQMNPHPVPEHLDYMVNGNGLPYGMSVPPEKSDEEPVEKKPLLSALSATESLTLLSTGQTLPSFNKFLLMKPGENSTPLKSTNIGTKSKADENTPPTDRELLADNGGGSSGRMQLSKLATSLPSWALLTNHFKASTFPFPYIVDPMGSSETFKLQQLVEKIDKQASSPNQCIICLRVLSCPRALRLHYSQHGGERPFKCKICGRAFSTKGNLKAHFVGHKSSPAAKAQNSCPICQKKFTNAVTLQQHIRMHLGGQIPNGVLPEGAGPKLAGLDESFPEQDFSDEDITDEDSLEASGSESEKVLGPVESEISSLGEEATTSISKPPALPVHDSPPPYTPPAARLQVESLGDLQQSFKSIEMAAIAALPNTQQDVGPQEDAAEAMDETQEYERTTASPAHRSTDRESSSAGPRETLAEVGTHACYICSAPFSSLDSLEQHIKGHSNDGLFQCPVCKQSFLEKTGLLSHMLMSHPWASRFPLSTALKPQAEGTSPQAQAPSELWPKTQAAITSLPALAPSELWPRFQAAGTSSPAEMPLELQLKPQAGITPVPAPIELWPKPPAVIISQPDPAPSELWSKPQAAITPLPAQAPTELWPKPQAMITPLPAQAPTELWPKLQATITPPPVLASSELQPKPQAEINPSPTPAPSELWPKPQAMITPLPTPTHSDSWLKPQAVMTPPPALVPTEQWPNSLAVITSPPALAPSEQWPKSPAVIMSPPVTAPSEQWSKPLARITSPPTLAPSELRPKPPAELTPSPPPSPSELRPKPHQAAITPPPAPASSELRPKNEVVGLPHMVTFLRALPPSTVASLSSGITPKPHACPVCQKIFSSFGALQIHERVHSEEKPFSCTMCERVFTTQGNLKVHMSTHVWDSSHARVARPLPLEPPAPPLFPGLSSPAAPNVPAGEDPVQLAKSGPLSFWNQYTAFLARSSEIPASDPASPAPPSPRPPSRPNEFTEKAPPTPEAASPAAEEK